MNNNYREIFEEMEEVLTEHDMIIEEEVEETKTAMHNYYELTKKTNDIAGLYEDEDGKFQCRMDGKDPWDLHEKVRKICLEKSHEDLASLMTFFLCKPYINNYGMLLDSVTLTDLEDRRGR